MQSRNRIEVTLLAAVISSMRAPLLQIPDEVVDVEARDAGLGDGPDLALAVQRNDRVDVGRVAGGAALEALLARLLLDDDRDDLVDHRPVDRERDLLLLLHDAAVALDLLRFVDVAFQDFGAGARLLRIHE